MSFAKNKLHTQEYLYDFAVDGGAHASAIVLSNKNGSAPLPATAIVKSVMAIIETAPLSDGSATVEWGTGTNTDGFSGAAIAKASLTLNSVWNGWDNAAAELWDDTNDHPIFYRPGSTAANQTFVVLINTAALTAGKIRFVVEFYMPGQES